MSKVQKNVLLGLIANDLQSDGVASIGRAAVLRAYGRERFTEGLYRELVDDLNVLLEDWTTVAEIRSTGWDNSHRFIILPSFLVDSYES